MPEKLRILFVDDDEQDILNIASNIEAEKVIDFVYGKATSYIEAEKILDQIVKGEKHYDIALIDSYLSSTNKLPSGKKLIQKFEEVGIPAILITHSPRKILSDIKYSWFKGDEIIVLIEMIQKLHDLQLHRQIFVIYSMDQIDFVNNLKEFLGKIGLKPVILSDFVRGHEAISTQLKDAIQSCSSAIVLLTPDDRAIRASQYDDALKRIDRDEKFIFQPRQNVILEWGYVTSTYDVSKVFVLKDPNTSILSDHIGKFYVDIGQPEEQWQRELYNQMVRSSLPVSPLDSWV